MNSLFGHGKFILVENRRFIHINPVAKQFISAYEFIIAIESWPIFSGIFIKEIDPDWSLRPALTLKLFDSIFIPNESSSDWFTIFINSNSDLCSMLVNEVIFINFDMRVGNNSDSFLLLFYFVEKFMETLKIGFIKFEISSAFCVFNIKPQVVHWHLQLIKFI